VTRVPERRDAAIRWLLEGDPSIRWQTLRDLVGAGERAVARERSRVAREGWGARLLARQRADGRWGAGRSTRTHAGLYGPKWISTTYTMLLLRDLGLPAGNRKARRACALLLDQGLREDGQIDFGDWARWTRKGETCVTGIVLSILAHFEHDDPRLDTVVRTLLAQQMRDGGWNCRRSSGDTHGSMHTTMSVLEALRLYGRFRPRGGRSPKLRAAERRGREFLLRHRLFRSHRTGAVIKPAFTRFVFPPRWHYDVLRGLDHFRAAGAKRDARLADAIELVRRARGEDGRWRLQGRYPGKTWFELERVGAPSRWNTLRALRVIQWWDSGS
jgi:hypothetical protein